jgi:hypothetical protein
VTDRGDRAWVRALTTAFLMVTVMFGAAAPAQAAHEVIGDEILFDRFSAPPGATVGVIIADDFVDAWLPEPGAVFRLFGEPHPADQTCQKQRPHVRCEFTVPSGMPSGPWTLQLVAQVGEFLLTGPTFEFDVEFPPPPPTTTTTLAPTTSTTPPPTTSAPTTSTTPPTTAGEVTATAPPATTLTTTSSSTTTQASTTSTTTGPVAVVDAASEIDSGGGGPGLLTVGIVGALAVALAVALTVLVVQNLPRNQDRG